VTVRVSAWARRAPTGRSSTSGRDGACPLHVLPSLRPVIMAPGTPLVTGAGNERARSSGTLPPRAVDLTHRRVPRLVGGSARARVRGLRRPVALVGRRPSTRSGSVRRVVRRAVAHASDRRLVAARCRGQWFRTTLTTRARAAPAAVRPDAVAIIAHTRPARRWSYVVAATPRRGSLWPGSCAWCAPRRSGCRLPPTSRRRGRVPRARASPDLGRRARRARSPSGPSTLRADRATVLFAGRRLPVRAEADRQAGRRRGHRGRLPALRHTVQFLWRPGPTTGRKLLAESDRSSSTGAFF